MNVAAYALCLALSQDPEAAPPPAEAPAEEAPAEGTPAPAVAAPSQARPKGADEVNRAVQKLPSLSPDDREAALSQLIKQFGAAETNPVLPLDDVNLGKYLELEPLKQAEVVARGFLADLIAGDTTRLIARSGYPFFLEGRRIDRAEELKAQWGVSLRSRRADLLKLYSVEVLQPADMEKKYGKPPQRLNSWSWRAPNTLVAVGNLSGHPTVLLLRQVGAAWQVVGFHD